jgi:hypothetical protein
MSLLRNLFGGSKSTQTSTSTPVDTTPEELRGLRQPFVTALSSVLQGEGRPAYQGPFVAGITDPERRGLTSVEGSANDPTRRNLLTATQGGAFLDQGNPFLQAAIQAAQRPTLQGLSETLTRDLPGRFTQAGQFTQPKGSSAFDRSAAIATRGAADAMGDIATKMSFQGYEAERGRQQQSIQLGQQEVDTMIKNLQAQGLPRLIEDLGIERGLQEFQSRVGSLLQALQIAAGAPIAQQGTQQTSTGTSTTQQGIIPGLFPKGPFATGS